MKKLDKIIIVSITSLLFFSGCKDRNIELTKNGDELVKKIEAYKRRTHRLPYSLQELGIKESEEGPLYYQKKDSVTFIVWFGKSLGESKTYYSERKKWEDHQ